MILIVGSGIIGMTTAIVLVSRGYKVTIIHDPTSQYASDKAGAHFRPLSSENGELRQLEQDTFTVFNNLVDMGVGIQYAIAEEYYTGDYQQSWLPIDYFKHKDFTMAVRYKQFIINVPLHLKILKEMLLELNVAFINEKITNLNELSDNYNAIINCTGLGAIALCQDPYMYPIRGQTVLVDASLITKSYFCEFEDHPYYVIPRGDGTCILGGTFLQNNHDTRVCSQTSARIIKNCQKLFKIEIKSIISEQVGLRPGRSTVRIEKDGNIIHNYGHGGYGWQTSYGSAFQVLRLVQQSIPMPGQHYTNLFLSRLTPMHNAKL